MTTVECESTIEFVGDFNFSVPPHAQLDIIFLLNGNLRVSSNKCEQKITSVSQNVCYFVKDRGIVPIKRTISTETLVAIPKTYTIERTIHRIHWTDRGVRHSVNTISCERGLKKTYEMEIEYHSTLPYDDIVQLEQQLANQFPFKFKLDEITLSNVFDAHSTRVQMCHHYNPNLLSVWAPKWNGVKGKVAFLKGIQHLWVDLQNVQRIYRKYDKILENICFACEVMDDKRKIIFDVCMIKYDGVSYAVEPLANIEMLKLLRPSLEKLGYNVQQFVKSELRETLPTDQTDGYIIVQGNNVIKWKYPTVDVEYDGVNFLVGDNTRLPAPKDPMLVPGCIFEISNNRIMRRRNDRITRSNQSEYEAYLKAISFCSEM